MIIAHLADLHLGYRAYSRVTATGVNQREADVAAVFAQAVEAVVRLQPGLVVVAGDVFHSFRPSNAAIAEAFRRFASLASRLPGVPIVIVAGDRDTPRSADGMTILELFREIPGIVVVTEGIEHILIDAEDTEVVAVSHAALAGRSRPALRASSSARTRVLVMHAALTGPRADRILRAPFAEGGARVDEDAVDVEQWDYVALGHHAVRAEVASNLHYAGSLERTSPDVWAEAGLPKGFLSYDTVLRTTTFHSLNAREVLDLPRISGRNRSPAEVTAAIESVLAGIRGGVRGRIVRLVITDISRSDLRQVDQRALRRARAEAVHFLLEPRPPQPQTERAATLPVRGVTLEAQVEEFLERVWTPTLEGVDRTKLVRLARRYLAEAGEGAEA